MAHGADVDTNANRRRDRGAPGLLGRDRLRASARLRIPDDVGRRIYEQVCADCWDYWFRNYSIKVINELRLDLSTEQGQAEYDRHMCDYLGFNETAPT